MGIRIACLIVVLLVVIASGQEQVVIGQSARIETPQSAAWNITVNDRPYNGEVVTQNPPLISWSYTPNPSNVVWDVTVYQFQFQAAYEPTFTNPVVDRRLSVNACSFIAPFTNNVMDSNVVYWRVYWLCTNQYLRNPYNTAYYESAITSEFRTNYVSSVRSFTIADNATLWDRHWLADSNYLTHKAVHPRLWFTSTNRADLYNWLETNTSVEVYDWANYVKPSAYRWITNTWWTSTNPTPSVETSDWAKRVMHVALVWQLTRDDRFLAEPTNICKVAENFALHAMRNRFDQLEPITFSSIPIYVQSIGFLYDWLYEVMTDTQKSNLLYACERICRFAYKGGGGLEYSFIPGIPWTNDNPFATWTNSFVAAEDSLFKKGNNHQPVYLQNAQPAALAAYESSQWAMAVLDVYFALQLSRPVAFGAPDGSLNNGRGYNYETAFAYPILYGHMLANSVFPEMQFNLNPFWTGCADWISRMTPVDFWEASEPWGDSGASSYLNVMSLKAMSRDLSIFTQSGPLWLHYYNAKTRKPWAMTQESAWLPLMYHYQQPEPETNQVLAAVYPDGGWTFSSTHAPNTTAGYLSGAGFIFTSRPSGYVGPSHNHPSDLTFQLWSHGTPITDSGFGMVPQSKLGWFHYSPAFNGYTPLRNAIQINDGIACKVIAFSNCNDFTYVAVDGTESYPKAPATYGGQSYNVDWSAYTTGPASNLTKINRHLLFMRKKYWVIMDDWEASQNSTYSFIWQVPGHTRDLIASNGWFSYVSTNGVDPTHVSNGSNVTVYAQSFIDPSLLVFTNMTPLLTSITNGESIDYVRPSLVNPITGENYTPRSRVTSSVTQPRPIGEPNPALIRWAMRKGTDATHNFYMWWTTNTPNATNVLIGGTVLETLTNTFNALQSYEWPWTNIISLSWSASNRFTVYFDTSLTYVNVEPAYSAFTVATTSPNFTPHGSALWHHNSTPSTEWKSAWVIYPVPPGASIPSFTRVDNSTMAITNGSEYDVISFDTNSVTATLIIDAGATNEFRLPTVLPPTFSISFPVEVAFPTNISISCGTIGATILYSTNGVTNVGNVVTMAYSGQQLTAWATNDGYLDSTFTIGYWLTNAPPQDQGSVSAPQFDPSHGTYTNSATVSMVTATPGASIHYTVNGATPNTNNAAYVTPIRIESTTTIKAIGAKAGLSNSAVSTAVYTIVSAASTNHATVRAASSRTIQIR